MSRRRLCASSRTKVPIAFLSIILFASVCLAYTPEVNHRAIAGLWKLIQKPVISSAVFAVKEFTVFPKDKDRENKSVNVRDLQEQQKEMLLMLKEDGSFQQYSDDDEPEQSIKIPDKLKYHKSDDAVFERFLGGIQGKWDLVDGKLILAADRPISDAEDTLLEGKVIATSEASLDSNPALAKDTDAVDKNRDHNTEKPTPSRRSSAFDTHLSIPRGKVNVGKFIYPKHHPSFFEQPMFHPTQKAKFELKQVLGSLNAKVADDEDETLIERFRAKDFYGKRFLLTSHPIGYRRPKGRLRWSIKYNKFVEDLPSSKARKQAEDEENRPVNIRVMEVAFFANNTFATVGGLGEAAILRGKFSIIGKERDQFWMQVTRFGFGRSVSGSVYSEGKSLTKEDEKAYWGKISLDEEEEAGDDLVVQDREDAGRRISVKGSVLFGYGLEPVPVGRFIMSETTDEVDYIDEDDDDEDDPQEDDFLDWSNSFQ